MCVPDFDTLYASNVHATLQNLSARSSIWRIGHLATWPSPFQLTLLKGYSSGLHASSNR